jgi:hypothetical protein
MKKIFIILLIIVIIGLVAWGVWFFAVSKNANSSGSSTGQTSSSGSLPAAPSSLPSRVQSKTESGTSIYVQNITSPQDSGVAAAFLNQIQNVDQIALGGTVIASQYALQIWGDANKGGEALLENTSGTEWTLVSLGGGEWSVLALIQEGVPVAAAEQLVTGLNNGVAPSTGSSMIIPPGDTLSIGTTKGTVTMDNFYNNAVYLDQAEQTVVIQQSSTYSIIYNIPDSNFAITIVGTPFASVRPTAEGAFLTTLGISQSDACKLSVTINAPYNVDSNPADQGVGLSFCGGGAFQE